MPNPPALNKAKRIPPALMSMVRTYFELIGPAFIERDRLEGLLRQQQAKITSLQDALTLQMVERGVVPEGMCYTIDQRYMVDGIAYAWTYDSTTATMPPGDKVN